MGRGNMPLASADTQPFHHLKSVDFSRPCFLSFFCFDLMQDKDSKEEKSIEELIKEYEDDGED